MLLKNTAQKCRAKMLLQMSLKNAAQNADQDAA